MRILAKTIMVICQIIGTPFMVIGFIMLFLSEYIGEYITPKPKPILYTSQPIKEKKQHNWKLVIAYSPKGDSNPMVGDELKALHKTIKKQQGLNSDEIL